MLVYRITKSKYATDISGTGAAIYPGRWNRKGIPVLYTGINPEIALLETIVHLPPMIAPSLDLLTLEVPEDSILIRRIEDLPPNWAYYPAPSILAEIGQKWVSEEKYLALQFPSCIISTSYILILNCLHSRFSEVKIIEQKRFLFDPRLKSKTFSMNNYQ